MTTLRNSKNTITAVEKGDRILDKIVAATMTGTKAQVEDEAAGLPIAEEAEEVAEEEAVDNTNLTFLRIKREWFYSW